MRRERVLRYGARRAPYPLSPRRRVIPAKAGTYSTIIVIPA